MSALLGLTLVSYFTPAPELWRGLLQGQIGLWEAVFAGSYGLFAFLQAGVLREKVCQHMCPYARFQGVMASPSSLWVRYDPVRGEPRRVIPLKAVGIGLGVKSREPGGECQTARGCAAAGVAAAMADGVVGGVVGGTASATERALGAGLAGAAVPTGARAAITPVVTPAIASGIVTDLTRSSGDCVNCHLCVDVCPVGIDIRDGDQYACIHCGLCADACDTMMRSSRKPKGLIRWANDEGRSGQVAWRQAWASPRARLYAGACLALLLVAAVLLALRAPMQVDVIRDRGVMSRVTGDGEVENVYRLHLQNLSPREVRWQLAAQAQDMPGLSLSVSPSAEVSLQPGEDRTVVLTLRAPAQALVQREARQRETGEEASRSMPLHWVVSGPEGRPVVESRFLWP